MRLKMRLKDWTKIISAVLVALMFMGMAALPAKAEGDEKPQIVYDKNGLQMRFIRLGTLDTSMDKATPFRSGGPDGKAQLDSLTIYEQSTYGPKVPNGFYYRTVGYKVALLNSNRIAISDGLIPVNESRVPLPGGFVYFPDKGRIDFQYAFVNTKYENTKEFRAESNSNVTAYIKSKYGSAGFNKPCVTSTVLSREYIIKALGLEGKEHLLDEARYLLRCGEVEFFQADAKGGEGPALDATGTKVYYNVLENSFSTDIHVPARFKSYEEDIQSRMQIIDLNTGKIEIIEGGKKEDMDIVLDKLDAGTQSAKPGTNYSGKITFHRASDSMPNPINTTIYLTAANGKITSSTDIPVNGLKPGETRTVPFDFQAGSDKSKPVTVVAEINPEKLGENRLIETTYDNNKKQVFIPMQEDKVDLSVQLAAWTDALYTNETDLFSARVYNTSEKPITTDIVWKFAGKQVRKANITVPAKSSAIDRVNLTMPNTSSASVSLEVEVNPSRNKPSNETTYANNKITEKIEVLKTDDSPSTGASDPYLVK